MNEQTKLINELTIMLEQNGLTFSTENGDPVTVRPILAEKLLKPVINHLVQEGYLASN